jgi:hypothetical protein
MLIELGELKPNAPGGDVLMQLAVLANLTELAIDGLGQPVDADRSRELQGWLEQIRKRNAGLLSVDWVELCHAPEPNTQQQRRDAAELDAAFPLKRGMTLVSSSQRLDGLNPYAPIGVMMPAGAGQPARRVVLWRPATDVLATRDGALLDLPGERIATRHTHGTGCTYAAAIVARLAGGQPLVEAIQAAKAWLTEALRGAPGIGGGVGPVDHFAPVAPRRG